ncbi:hypothetical protein [Ruania rhizosphaerae]|uniref:hypothetical protein n=1 Tax=Ruania rhizosphaerae TaxID=1840413 RepID=UPI00135C46F8|nr:hypothetical protein [Ruania rhizosphaerae]
MTSLGQSTANMLARMTTSGWRLGTVLEVDAPTGTLTLDLGGETVSGVPWQASAYSPVVEDVVTVHWDRTHGLLVTGTISTVQVDEPEPVTRALPSTDEVAWEMSDEDNDGTWSPTLFYPDGIEWATQGTDPRQGGDEPPDFVAPIIVWATMITWEDLPDRIPGGATGVRLLARVKRVDRAGDYGPYQPRKQLVSPVLWGHSYTQAAPPADNVAPTLTHGPWLPGQLAAASEWGAGDGEQATWPIPQALQDDLISGAATGLALYTDDIDETASFAISLVLTYTPPPEV